MQIRLILNAGALLLSILYAPPSDAADKNTLEKISNAALYDAMHCTIEIATRYAQIKEEEAKEVARISVAECAPKWYIFNKTTLDVSNFEFEELTGQKAPESAKLVSSDFSQFELEIEKLVFQWRYKARILGSAVFDSALAEFEGRK